MSTKKVEVNSDNFQKYLVTINEIDNHFSLIREETGLYSNHKHMLEHKSLALVEMGDVLINYLFHKIIKSGSSWTTIHLLNKIAKNGPIIPKEHWGKIFYLTIDWLSWYVETDYYKNNDVYHNLVTDETRHELLPKEDIEPRTKDLQRH